MIFYRLLPHNYCEAFEIENIRNTRGTYTVPKEHLPKNFCKLACEHCFILHTFMLVQEFTKNWKSSLSQMFYGISMYSVTIISLLLIILVHTCVM